MRLLAILYCYPPLLVPASICYLKLVVGLRQLGVDVELVTIEPASFSPPGETVLHDEGLARMAPADVVEHRFRSPETSLFVRGLKRLDRRRRFTYPILEPKKREWIWPAARALRRMDLRRFDAILSCSQPHANHLLGLELKRRTGLPWVAYFSDPWSDNPYAQFFSQRVARHNRKLEDNVLASADLVLYTSEEMLRLVQATHPVLATRRTGVVPHAFVPGWYGNSGANVDVRQDGPVRLLHTGHFYGPRTPLPLIDALTRLRAKVALDGKLTVTCFGTMPASDVALVRERGLQEVVCLRDTVPYLESLAQMHTHDGLLLIDAKLQHGSESVFLPSKLVDYLGTGKPILAITPGSGASARVVTATGGVVCDIENPGTLDAALEGIIQSRTVPWSPNVPAVQEYEVSRVAGRLVDMLDTMLRDRRHG